MFGQRPGQGGGVDMLRLTSQVTQKVDLMNAAINEHAPAVQVPVASPLTGLEGGLLLKLDQSQVADRAAINQFFTLSYCG
jgi:hypothetical protein